MSRAATSRRARMLAAVDRPVRPGPTYSAETPTAGYYRSKLVKGGVAVGVRIWFGPPLDPVTGEEMDRSHRWQAQVNGECVDIDRVWPFGIGERIDQREYDYLRRLAEWAAGELPDSPLANPRKPVDLLTAPLLI